MSSSFPKAVEKELQISVVASQKELSFSFLLIDCGGPGHGYILGAV